MTSTGQDKIELLPCPCCGSANVTLWNEAPLAQPPYWEWRVTCVACGLSSCVWGVASVAVSRWNARSGNRSDA